MLEVELHHQTLCWQRRRFQSESTVCALDSTASCNDRERIKFERQEYAAQHADHSWESSWGVLSATTKQSFRSTEKNSTSSEDICSCTRSKRYMSGFEMHCAASWRRWRLSRWSADGLSALCGLGHVSQLPVLVAHVLDGRAGFEGKISRWLVMESAKR